MPWAGLTRPSWLPSLDQGCNDPSGNTNKCIVAAHLDPLLTTPWRIQSMGAVIINNILPSAEFVGKAVPVAQVSGVVITAVVAVVTRVPVVAPAFRTVSCNTPFICATPLCVGKSYF